MPSKKPDLHLHLRDLRKAARVSAETIAPLVGLTPSSLRARERGEREWYPELVDAYVSAVRACANQRSQDVVKGARTILGRSPARQRSAAAARTPAAGS